ncbi:MAG: CRISPR-associated endonuclease Cas3'', partial [Leptospiraceae bacterium]|nr:CRISPR-associated endonuclease Cas3'' [Leptospiraceae bacterium]
MNLLAKSYGGLRRGATPPEYAFLEHHSIATARVALVLVRRLKSVIQEWSGFTGETLKYYEKMLILSAGFHDYGKANEDYQHFIKRGGRQLFRHEYLSLYVLLHDSVLSAWWQTILPSPEIQRIGLFAIVGHHLKASIERFKSIEYHYAQVKAWWHSNQTIYLINEICRLAGVEPPQYESANEKGDKEDAERIFASIENWIRSCLLDELDCAYERPLALARAIVIAADRLASATNGPDELESWADGALSTVLSRSDIQSIIIQSLGDKRLHPFQEAVGKSADRITVVQAGCGNG